MLRLAFHPGYVIPLPPRHSFPMRKFAHLHQIVLDEHLTPPAAILTPQPAPWTLLRNTHDADFLEALRTGTMSPAAVRRMGFPWTEALIRRSRLAVAGTLLAAQAALDHSLAGNLAGGTHHAFADHAEGFCVLNDVAVSCKHLLETHSIRRALVIDLDVHQGNGTASIFQHDPRVFTFSMHGSKNFPMHKERSDRDVPLDDALTDDQYLGILETELDQLLDRATRTMQAPPDLVFYLAGVDVLADDKFGRLSLTRAGLEARDRMVIERITAASLPLCLLLSGGYSPTPEETADNHAVMHRIAAPIARALASAAPA